MLSFGELQDSGPTLGFAADAELHGERMFLAVFGGIGQAVIVLRPYSSCCEGLALKYCYSCGTLSDSPTFYGVWDYDTREVTALSEDKFDLAPFLELVSEQVGSYGSIVFMSQLCAEITEFLNEQEFPTKFFL